MSPHSGLAWTEATRAPHRCHDRLVEAMNQLGVQPICTIVPALPCEWTDVVASSSKISAAIDGNLVAFMLCMLIGCILMLPKLS